MIEGTTSIEAAGSAARDSRDAVECREHWMRCICKDPGEGLCRRERERNEQRRLQQRYDWTGGEIGERSDDADAAEVPRDQGRRNNGCHDGSEKLLVDLLETRWLVSLEYPASQLSTRYESSDADDAELISKIENRSRIDKRRKSTNGETRPWRRWTLREL
jgi:hypothetical protein